MLTRTKKHKNLFFRKTGEISCLVAGWNFGIRMGYFQAIDLKFSYIFSYVWWSCEMSNIWRHAFSYIRSDGEPLPLKRHPSSLLEMYFQLKLNIWSQKVELSQVFCEILTLPKININWQENYSFEDKCIGEDDFRWKTQFVCLYNISTLQEVNTVPPLHPPLK